MNTWVLLLHFLLKGYPTSQLNVKAFPWPRLFKWMFYSHCWKFPCLLHPTHDKSKKSFMNFPLLAAITQTINYRKFSVRCFPFTKNCKMLFIEMLYLATKKLFYPDLNGNFNFHTMIIFIEELFKRKNNINHELFCSTNPIYL